MSFAAELNGVASVMRSANSPRPADFEGKRSDGKLRPVPYTNVHAVWDDSLIDTRTFSWGSYAAELEKTVAPGITDVSLAMALPSSGSTSVIRSGRSSIRSSRRRTPMA